MPLQPLPETDHSVPLVIFRAHQSAIKVPPFLDGTSKTAPGQPHKGTFYHTRELPTSIGGVNLGVYVPTVRCSPTVHFRDNTVSGNNGRQPECQRPRSAKWNNSSTNRPWSTPLFLLPNSALIAILKTHTAATQRFRGGIGLRELLLEAAWANGYAGRNFRDSRAVLRFAFRPELEAGFSTIDIGGILSNVANKFLLDGFFSVERTWRNICAVRNVSDFKTVTSYRLIGTDQYEQLAPGGEF